MKGVNINKQDADISKENFVIASELLNKNKIDFLIVFGTLLGLYRDGKIIEYDNDTDFAVFNKDRELINDVLNGDDFKSSGFSVIRKTNELISIIRKNLYIDLYIFSNENDKNKYWCYDYFLMNSEIENKQLFKNDFAENIYAPGNIEYYLERHYGEDWKIPQKGFPALTASTMMKYYWENYYHNNKETQQSSFAEFIVVYLDMNKTMLDIGCGKAEDTIYLSKYCNRITGIDDNVTFSEIVAPDNVDFIKLNFYNIHNHKQKYDYIYLRWVLHSTLENVGGSLLDFCLKSLKSNGRLFIEARTMNDQLYGKGIKIGENEYIYGHYRRFIDTQKLKEEINIRGLKIEYENESDGWSFISEENNPTLIRIVAKKPYKYKWGILIPTIVERKAMFDWLVENLNNQIKDNGLEEEVIVYSLSDNREMSIGDKRNKLIQMADSEFTCFVDDDDAVSTNYVKLIYDAIKKDNDCVSLVGEITIDGKNPKTFIHSIRYKEYSEKNGIYYRPPNHLNPIKREIAIKKMFPEVNFNEDTQWTMAICNDNLIKTESQIDEPYYFYRFNSNK